MRNNNFSSSEDFTESQNFDRFLNAEDSDAEDKALQSTVNKKMQSKGFYDSKAPATKTYPSYQGASYGGASGSQGYDGGYGTGYGGYGGASYGGSGYGGGYGNANTANKFGGSGNKQGSGYGTGGYGDYGGGYGGGYGASGYGAASGYGGGYGAGYSGGGNAYSGYDITGFGGSGYGGTGGGGTGYKDNDDEDEYGDDYEDEDDENKEEGGGFGLDLKSVMERKAAQKAAKEAEEKKAEEEKAKKAKAAAAAQASSLKGSGLKTSGSKKDKGKGKVSFDLGAEIPDDSDNENNQNISHISEEKEKSHSSDSSDRGNRFKTAKSKDKDKDKKEKEDLSSKMILNMSDDKSSETSDRKKGNMESVDDVDSEKTPKTNTYANTLTQNKSTPKKEEISDSYADDFEESSKFGSSDYGKTNLKIATKVPEKKTDDFEESSNYLTESKENQNEEKPSTKTDERPGIKDTYNKPQNLVYQPVASTLTQNYETRAAKDYVYESLLNDERRRVDKLENQLNLGGDQLKTVQQLVQEKDLTIHKLEAQTQGLQKELDAQKSEAQDLAKQNKIYEVELENQQKRIEVLENKVLEVESQKRILAKDNEDKTKTLKERKEYLEKNFESKALSELRSQFENEKDLLMMKIEELQDENKKFKEEVDKTKQDSRLYKTNFREKAESDQEVKRLKQEIVVLEMKLNARDQIKQKKVSEHVEQEKENINLISGIPELDKETQMQELLIKGFQKENEKLMSENKLLKREIEELHGRLYDENKKTTEMKVKLVNNTDSVLITDKEIDIETKKMLGAENLISKNDLKAAQMKVSQLHHEMQTREDAFKQREMEMKYEMDRLRAQKIELEGKIGGVDMGSLKKQDEDYKQLQRSVEEERRMHENELRDLKSKLNWYIENQDSLNAKEEVIRQKNEAIKNLEAEIAKILSDPNTNMDAKSKHYTKVSNEDKKRIKQLEKDVENLEEALKKRNPGLYDKMKSQQDESITVKELRQSLKKIQEEKSAIEAEYETKLNDFRQRFDKMKLGYETKSGDTAGGKGEKEKSANPADNQEKEVLKARIKELEKEVEDAKKYYLKKAQQLKDNKKGGKTIEKPKSAVPASKKVQFDVRDETESQFSEDKENIKSAGNGIVEEEKANLIENLVNLHLTPVHSLLNTFESYKNNIINGFERSNKQLISTSTLDLTNVISSTLSGFSQREEILQKLRRAEELAIKEKKDPLPTVEAAQNILYDLVWTEIRKEKSILATNISKTSAKVNNFFNQNQDQDSDVSDRKLIVLEETLKKKEEDLLTTQQKLNQITSENVRLLKDKSNLELIIQQLPKNPRSLDFATMEKKLEIMERNYKENELELKNAFRKAYNMDPFQATSEADINKVKAYEKEISQLKSALDRKNQEIYVFRQEMEVILKELNKLRRNKA